MDKKDLKQRTEALIEAIENLNNSRHNPSDVLEKYARDLFERLLDEITSGN